MSKINLSNVDVIRAWKDEAYRMSLTAAQRAALPANPAGAIELNDAQLDDVSAGKPANTPGSGNHCGTGRCSKHKGTGGNCCA